MREREGVILRERERERERRSESTELSEDLLSNGGEAEW